MRSLLLAAFLLTATHALASEAGLSGSEGHPRERWPLGIHLASFGDATLDATAARVLDDWNAVARDALLREVRADFAGPVVIGEDLLAIDLPERTVSFEDLRLALGSA